MGETHPEVIERAASALKEKVRHFGRTEDTAEIDGMGALTAILKHSDVSFGDRLLDELSYEDPELSKGLKDRLYTLDDVVLASDRPIQEQLHSMSDKDIALLIKGRSETFVKKIMDNLSTGRGERIREETGIMGAVPRIEAEAAAREFLAWFRLNREEGRILMMNDEDVVL
jgi:flagellar motor switch protein FliG